MRERRTNQRKRASAEVFSLDYEFNPISSEEKLEDDKENPLYSFDVQGGGHSRQRAYSTSIVRESVERKPLMPLNKHCDFPFNQTYRVLPSSSRQIRKETFTIFKKPRPGKIVVKKEEIKNHRSVTEVNKNKQKCEMKNPELDAEQKRKDFIKILIKKNRFKLGDISPEDSMGSYIQAMRVYLEECLGTEMFIAVYMCLNMNMGEGEHCCTDVTSKLFEIMSEEYVTYVPLILQLIQCESSFS